MPKNDTPVANPPAGGPQAFASTNDDNVNDVLQSTPYVVTIAAHGQVGVVARTADLAGATALAESYRVDRPAFVSIDARKENDPDNGLPALLAEVEGAELAAASTDEGAADEGPAKPKGDEGPKSSSAKK